MTKQQKTIIFLKVNCIILDFKICFHYCHLIDSYNYVVQSLKSCLTLQPHGLQHTRILCSPLSPRFCSNSCPLNWWCYLTISTSDAPFPFAYNLSQHKSLFQWVALYIRQSKYWSFSCGISPSNEYSVLIFFRIVWFDLLQSKGLSRVFPSSTVWKHQFFRGHTSI